MDIDAEDDFSLDEAREMLFTLQRASERQAAALGKVVEAMNSKQPDDEWLLEVLDEAAKGQAFHQQQLELFTNFHARANAYVEAVRNEANQLAIQELQGTNGQSEDGGDGQDGNGGEASTSACGVAAAAVTPGAGQRRKSSKIVHPELLKFKLEKQAKILGKYGGAPALGAGLVLPRLQRDSILKATGSPAAREIHYSKVENKDASNLAEVMRFKVRKGEDAAANGGTPAPSPWQAEVSAKKGKSALDGTDQKDLVTPSTRSHAVYGEELGGVLQQRQAELEAAMAAQRAAPVAAEGPQISADAAAELAEKLKRRQAAAKQMEEEEAAAAAEAAEAEAPPVTPAWSNAAAPFGGELTAAIQRRAEQQRQTGSNGGGSGSGAASGGGGPSEPSTSAAAAAPAKPAAAAPSPTPSLPGARGPAAAAGPSTSTSAAPATPAAGFVTPAGIARRTAPPVGLAGMMATPPGPAAAAATNELQEKLRRRLSALDAQTPSPPPP